MSRTSYSSSIAVSFFVSVPVRWAWFSLILLICSFSALAQTERSPRLAVENNLPGSATPEGAIKEPQEQQKVAGTISGSVVGQDGVTLAGVKVKLAMEGQLVSQEVLTGEDGQFRFTNVAPGSFQLTISSEGFSANIPPPACCTLRKTWSCRRSRWCLPQMLRRCVWNYRPSKSRKNR